MGDDVRSTALEVLASLLEAAAYWRRDFSYTLAEAVAPLAAARRRRAFATSTRTRGRRGKRRGRTTTMRMMMMTTRAPIWRPTRRSRRRPRRR